MDYTEHQLSELLRAKHSEDVFVPRCKNGPTTTGGSRLRILDAWAMNRSWSRMTWYGYEIKVSRSDFLRDEKWTDYLALCNVLYFVAPPNVIDPRELPANVGLLVCSTNAKRLYTKKKAVRREIDPPVDLFLYLLMCRTVISDGDLDPEYGRAHRIAYWQRVLEQKKKARDIDYSLKGKISERIAELRQRTDAAEARAHTLEYVERRIVELGFDPEQPLSDWRISQKLQELRDDIPHDLTFTIRRATDNLNTLVEKIEALKGGVST